MLSVPTLWVVFVANFLALTLVWAYVIRSYPDFAAARYWAMGAFCAAIGAAVSVLRGGTIDPLVPILGGAALLDLACCVAYMGIRSFYDEKVTWRLAASVVGLSVAGLALFSVWHDNMAARILVYSVGQSVPVAMTLKLLWKRHGSSANPGVRMTVIIAALFIAIHALRSALALFGIGGSLTLVQFNAVQAAMIVVLVFVSMAWNFGFLLMSIDRLRAEVADLALLDDLTGVANRRHLLRRLTDECLNSRRSGDLFALLAIDLDGFKAINDAHGHAAGDECLRTFTRTVQSQLRPGDLLARSGGDEFCVVLPASTAREGAMIARRVLEACRVQFAQWQGQAIPIAVSIGVAQWAPQTGIYPERLIAAADQALYVAKKGGKNRHVVHDPAPPSAAPAPFRISA